MKAPIDNFKLREWPNGSITQWFGENPELYGAAYMKNRMAGHNGIDIVAPHGSPIYSVSDGVVYAVRRDETGYGRHVRIRENKRGADDVVRAWTYGHLDTILVEKGQRVKAGQQIATMGNTGFVISGATPYWKNNPFAGTHLHLGVRDMWDDRVLNYENGYYGSYDPKPLLASVSDDRATIEKQLTLISSLNRLVELYKKLIELKK